MTKPMRKRRLKNYLLDRRFQLKYAGYMVAVTVVLSATLGFFLWRTSRSLIATSNQAVAQGRKIVSLGKEVTKESQTVSDVVEMNIAEKYGDNPELAAVFKQGAEEQKKRLADQQKSLEAQAAALEQQSGVLASEQRTMFIALLSLLSLLVVGVGGVGIVVTHKVAGPIFKMTRQINEIAEGHWAMPDPLRKGDELVGFFGAFDKMVRNLRESREEEIAVLDAAIESLAKAESDPDHRSAKILAEDLARLSDLRAEMKKALVS